jgi:hypothetical protein
MGSGTGKRFLLTGNSWGMVSVQKVLLTTSDLKLVTKHVPTIQRFKSDNINPPVDG